MLLEINSDELICLVFWAEFLIASGIDKEMDRRLRKRLVKMIGEIEGIPFSEMPYTDLPKYQPGEGPGNGKAVSIDPDR